MTDPAALFDSVRDEAGRVLVGNEDILEGMTISLLTRGHVLLEGVPGVAKTTIANLFARTLGLEYRRVQMTPDLLPADITGTRIYRSQTGEFDLQKGPVFSNVVVADEINRATPKTQSALLEAMQEQQVTIEGETHKLPSPFMLIATQNPIEMEGTFGLPEAQRDRFALKLRVDIPDRQLETRLLDAFNAEPELSAEQVQRVVTREEILEARKVVQDVFVKDSVRDYILDIVEATRTSSDLAYGASPRAAITLLQTAKARAAIEGRDYVIPDDVKQLATQVLAHRFVLSTDAELSDVSPESIIRTILDSVTPPEGNYQNVAVSAVGDGGDTLDGDGVPTNDGDENN
jgi:MoxR-like ATPase